MDNSRFSPLSVLFPWLSPIVVKFAVVDGGIEVQLYRNNQLLKNWHDSGLRRALPEPFIKWIDTYQLAVSPQPYPVARWLWQSLMPLTSKKFLVDASALAELEEISQPQNLKLVWTLNSSMLRIEGHYEGADRYLGMGWFQNGKKICALHTPVSPAIDWQLRNLIVPVEQCKHFLNSVIPDLQKYLPNRVDFQYITDFTPQVTVLDANHHRLVLRLQGNYVSLLPMHPIPQQQVDILLANQAIVQFSYQALTPALVNLLSGVSHLEIWGNDIPVFISQQLPIWQKYGLINADKVANITQSNPIVSIATLKPTVSLNHTSKYGVGMYATSTTYQYQQHTLDMKALLAGRQQDQRFVQQHNIWFEWPANSKGLSEAIQAQLMTRVLHPEEVMGFDVQKLDFVKQQPIARDIQLRGATPAERGNVLFEQLRYHGIPAGIMGEPVVIMAMFVNVCENLLRDNQQVRILWLVSSNRKGSVTRTINNSTLKNHVVVASPVTLRDEPGILSRLWTLVIFQELDQLWSEISQFRNLSRYQTNWILASITSPYQLSPSAMQALHLAEKYYREFCSLYIFDLQKYTNNVATSKDTSIPNTAQERARVEPKLVVDKQEPRNQTPSFPPPVAPKPVAPSSGASSTTPKLTPSTGYQSEKTSRPADPPPVVSVRPNIDKPSVSRDETAKSDRMAALVPSRHISFWEQARQWKDISWSPVPFVPYQNSYPIYTDMNTKELQWYFYWRQEVRSGRYPSTDIGYILMHIYEALSCIGFATPALACERLRALWTHYRASFPQLDDYLIPWIADFCIVYKLTFTAIQWYITLLTVPDCAVDEQLIAHAWLRMSGDWAQMPSAVFYKIAGLDNQPIFYQKGKSDPKLGAVALTSIAGVEKYLRSEKRVSGLIGFYGRGARYAVKREPFKGALTEHTYSQITVAEINQAFNNIEFHRALAGIVKYTDYLQRKLSQNTTESFSPTIDVSWQEAIESMLSDKSLAQLRSSMDLREQQSSDSMLQESRSLLVYLLQEKTERELKQLRIMHSTDAQVLLEQILIKPASSFLTLPDIVPGTIQALHGEAEEKVPERTRPTPILSPKRHTIELNQKIISQLHRESEQLQERLIVEDDKEQHSLSSITQQAANASEESRDASKTEAKQVPEKVVPQEKVANRSDTEQSQKKEPALSAANTKALSFWEQARQWKDSSHEPVSLEKFKHYHSDYTLMDTKQLAWYFYWRNEIRSGLYLETDIGYVLIHAYEALECIGFTNPTQACERLIALWKNYRDSFPLLDQYLIPWIADFCVVHNLSLTPMQWYAQVLTVPDCGDADAQLIAEAWLRQGFDWTQVPAAVLYKLAGFNTQTKFYQKMRQKNALDKGYRLAVAAVDEYLSSKFDRPALITRYGKGKPYVVVRKPFNGVLMEHSYAPVVIAEINAAFDKVELRYALLGILKYADYIQRKMYQNAVQVFAPTIDLSWQEVIESTLAKKSPTQNSAFLSANYLADESDQEAISKLQEQDEKLERKEQYQKTLRPISASVMAVGIIGQFDSQLSKNARKEETHLKKTAQKKPITTNVVPSTTGSKLQSVHISAIEQRVAVLKQYWHHFDEIHARQTEGMEPLHGSPITDPLSIGFEDRCHFYKPDPYPLYQRYLPANLLSEVEQLWGTTMLPRWPECVVSEPFPHEVLTKAFGVALSFWHSCALNAWFFCEGTLYLDDLSRLEDFYRKKIQILEDMGMPINVRLFKDMGMASVKFGRVYPIDNGTRRGGFEGIRNIISHYRRLWAETYLDRYIQERWETEVRKAEISYNFSTSNRGGVPPTAKQFAKDAKNTTNYWFGGDISRLYEALQEQAPLQPQRVAILPSDRLKFALTVFNTLKEGVVKPQQSPQDPYTVERRYYQLNQLAEFSFWYVQIEEALGHTPTLSDFGTSKFAKYSEVLNKNAYKAWAAFSSAIEAAKRDFPVSVEDQESVKATFTKVESAFVKVQKSVELMVEGEKSTRPPWVQPAVPLDTEAILKLRAESDQLQVRLTIEAERKEEDRAEQSPQFISISEVGPVTPVISDISNSDLEIDEDWKIILQQWKPEHWEIIILLYQEQYAQLITVERKFRRPVSRLIDEINLPVDEQLGDLLVDPDTRLISQHLHAIVSTLVNWYLSSKK